ncbi:hypothetical protein NESM_000577200 [Novymonas esmeraldas]|uniref:Nuclear pore complex protein Nup85 n=1 Tax=Novymonas esmeraldas TaxID=1808958 RepID=A0AAW0ES92_9TRYP
MSGTWLRALLTYTTRTTGAPSTSVAARRRLCDEVFAAHLHEHVPGAALHRDALPVLREVRWSLLREGSRADKAQLLEHVMEQYTRASERVLAAAAAVARSDTDPGNAACTPPQPPMPCASQARTSQRLPARSVDTSAGSGNLLLAGAAPRDTNVLLQLLLEQLQCLVEAKVSDIPLSARHYRHPMRSPLLAAVSPELPLLLLEELAQQRSSSSQAAIDDDVAVRVDCCVGLAAAGHAREALALCGADGSVLRTVVQRAAALRPDGWRSAWALANAVPLSRVLDDAAADAGGTATHAWLRGVLEAAHLRHRAAVDAGAHDERGEVFDWVGTLRRLVVTAPTAAEGAEQRQRATPTARRLVTDAYLSMCPASRWRDAFGLALEMAATSTPPPGRHDGGGADGVTMGRLMAVLQSAGQPWMVLLCFYGDPRRLRAAGDTQWRVDDSAVESHATECVRAARAAGALAVATGALLKDVDRRHSAVYNHTLAALAATGQHTEAMSLYTSLPRVLVNRHTHWSVLHAFLRPSHDHRAVAALRGADNYMHCVGALRHLAGAGDAAAGTAPPLIFTRDQGDVWESMTLWAAVRGDLETVVLCAAHAPAASRYVRVIALLAAATARTRGSDGGWSVAREQLRRICAAPQTTGRELCLATAAAAVFFPCTGTDGATAAGAPERAALFAEVARAVAHHAERSQPRLDELLRLLVDYTVSLRRRRCSPATPQDTETALDNVLVKEKILASTMDLACPGAGAGTHDRHRVEDAGPAVWRTLARVMTTAAELQGLSAARAAPALVSAGAPPDIAIDLLPA